jgi:probable selenium-dependent hydroxylase accessory protein YqeC
MRSPQLFKDALDVHPRDMVSFIGAGGKTTSLFRLAGELRTEGHKLLVTTTTKIFRPAKPHVDRLFLVDEAEALLTETGPIAPPVIIGVGRRVDADGKLIGLPPEWVERLHASGQFDAILIEADGAASRLFKIPAENEPVVPEHCNLVVWVMSIKVVGKPLDAQFVHRAERAVRLLGVAAGAPLTRSTIVRLLEHPLGPFKGIPPGARKIALLNQADAPDEIEEAQRLANDMISLGFERIVISSFLSEAPLKQILSSARSSN